MASPSPATVVGWRGLLRHRRYVLYLASLSPGGIGYSVYAVAAPWLAYEVTHDLLAVGAVLAAEFGLYALSFVAAPFVDRAPEKRSILLAGYTLQAVAALLLGGLSLTGRLTFPLLLGLVSSISLLWDFTWSANNAVPPAILPREALFRASGFAGLLSGGNQVTGFTVGGALILATGAGGAMVLYGVLNALAALLALGVSTRGAPSAHGSGREALKEGWLAVLSPPEKGARPILLLAVYVALQGFFAPGSVLLITKLASSASASGSFTYGVLFTAFVLGGSAVGVGLGQVDPRRHVGRWRLASPAISAALLALAPFSLPAWPGGVFLWIGVGGAMLSFEVCYMVYLQASSPAEQVARTTSNVFLFRGSARASGALVLGGAATLLSVGQLSTLLTVGLLAVVGVGLLAWGRGLGRLAF